MMLNREAIFRTSVPENVDNFLNHTKWNIISYDIKQQIFNVLKYGHVCLTTFKLTKTSTALIINSSLLTITLMFMNTTQLSCIQNMF